MEDHIKVHGLSTTAILSESPWTSVDASLKPVSQPVIITLDIVHDIQAASRSDDLTRSVDYSSVSKVALSACNPDPSSSIPPAPTAYGLTERIIEHCLAALSQPVSRFGAELELPKAVLRAKSAGVIVSRHKDGTLANRHKFYIKELPVHTIVGIHPHEREEKQPIFISLDLVHATDLDKSFKINFAKLERRISIFVEASSYLTVEALTSEICRETLEWLDDPTPFLVTVSLKKPAALRTADGPEILITRSISDFPSSKTTSSRKPTTGKTFATLALGANLGDRFQNIELALRHLENYQSLWSSDAPSGEIDVIDTSFMYETAPMYVVSQPSFINCACLIETTLTAYDLLKVCKQIEKIIGRVPSVRFGPRAVDLDIVTFGDLVVDTRAPDDRSSLDNLEGQLIIPHPRLAEREFVLRPLRDIVPEWVHPELHLSVRSLLAKLLLAKAPEEPPMHKVMPFPAFQAQQQHPTEDKPPETQTYWTFSDTQIVSGTPNRRVYTMATLNVTPDSFSDGSKHNALETALSYTREAVSAGAAIIDVGGYSTRPGAAFVSQSEEISRIVPVIQAIRNDSDIRLRNIPISIDTFRAEVARAAIEAGANCINDVYAFSGPQYPPSPASETNFSESEMQAVAREIRAPVVMMHSRGEAGENKDYSLYDMAGQGRTVLEGVRAELGKKVSKVTKGRGSLRRWQVMVDPGVGFSKTVEGNLEILRNASLLTADSTVPPLTSSFNTDLNGLPYTTPESNPLAGYPLLIGTSRKSFLGPLISQPLPPAALEASSRSVPNLARSSLTRPANERDFATAAAVVCAIQQGASVVRVHAVSEMMDVVKVASVL